MQLREFPGKTWMKNISFGEPVTFHNIFEPTSYLMAFKVKKIRESGRYREIIETYVKD